ncbi:MAG TPA: glycosyltransferase family 2 protein [Candidatus Nanoarchaeia archaeon]|nr:glycosyltransferase family 2 protein [Candidatus Nanoarchaeia archaeon]
MKKPKVLIVTLNYNNLPDTEDFIKTASKLNYKNFKILIADNSKDNKGFVYLKKKYPKVIHIFNNGNLGCSGGNNVGINYAINNGFKYVWIMNNDVEIDRNCLNEMVNVIQKNKKAAAVGSKYYDFEKRNLLMSVARKMVWRTGRLVCTFGEAEDKGQFDHIKEAEYVWAGSVMYDVDKIKKVGFYDDNIFVYYEALDYQLRVKNAGYKVLIAPKAKVWHKGGRSQPTRIIFDYYTTRNRILVMEKHARFSDKFFFFLYLFFFATPSNLLRRIVKLKFKSTKWFLIGLFDGLFENYGRKEFS